MAKAAKAKNEKAVPAGVSMNAAQTKAVSALPTVSARIRYLNDEGYSRGEITKLIPNASGGQLRYQHVRNVLVTPITKAQA